MFRIIVKTKKGIESIIECNKDSCTIGKGDDNLVSLLGWTMGKKHATLFNKTEGIFIEHNDRKGETTVNGLRVIESYGPLQTHDHVQIGDYIIRVEREEQKELANEDQKIQLAINKEQLDPSDVVQPAASATATIEFEARTRVHKALIQQMDLRRFDVTGVDDEILREKTSALIAEVISKEVGLPDTVDRDQLAKWVLDEAIGLGPLEELLADDSVSEIMVNRFDEIFIERKGKLQLSPICFTSDQAVLSAIERIVAPLGRRIDESSPMVDARLKDGSRVNAVIPPLALKGCNITIRKFAKNKLVAADLVKFGSISQQMVDFMQIAVEQRCNVIISGGTGSGKTTLLNVLSNFIPDDQRIITCEDAAELKLGQSNLIALESRPPNSEGKGAVAIRDLVKNCLRMRPDRIVIGECRGGEALDMLQAMNTGHDGSLTTVHANTPRDAISRIETMVMMSGMDLPITAIREQIQSAVHLIIQQSRFHDGSRKVTYITEVTGMENGLIQLQDIFRYQQEGMTSEGKVLGKFVATGAIPELYEDLKKRGLEVDLRIFSKSGEIS